MIRPISAEVYLKYRCAKCHCEWDKTLKEVKLLGGMICGGCETYSKFEPISEIRVTPIFSTETVKAPKQTQTNKQVELSDVKKDAISALISLGCGSKESREFVTTHEYDTIEEYITAAVKKG